MGFETPFPDFTECNQTSREPNSDWKAIIHQGGPARGFSEIMPSFTEALKPDQIEKVIEYMRGFCRERWPRDRAIHNNFQSLRKSWIIPIGGRFPPTVPARQQHFGWKRI